MLMMALLLMVAGVNAQKVDQRLTGLAEKYAQRRAQGGHVVSAEGMSKTMAMVLNDDGSIKALSAIARLEDGAECPTAQLEQMGIMVRYVLGDQVALLIPTDKLAALEQVEEFRYVKPDLMRETTNRVARTETKADISGDATKAVANGLPQAYTENRPIN